MPLPSSRVTKLSQVMYHAFFLYVLRKIKEGFVCGIFVIPALFYIYGFKFLKQFFYEVLRQYIIFSAGKYFRVIFLRVHAQRDV